MFRNRIILLGLSVLLVTSCKQGGEDERQGPTVTKPTTEDVTEAPKLPLKDKLKKKNRNKKILVGGCKATCSDPLNAFRNFASAVWELPGQELPPAIRFMNTAAMIDQDEKLGKRWAGLFLEGKTALRQEEIDQWFQGLVQRLGRVKEPVALEERLRERLDTTRLSSREVKVHFAMPDTVTLEGGEVWHFTMGLRGREWLVKEIRAPE